MSLNSVQSFVIENCNGPTNENGLNNVCLHPLSRTFTFTFNKQTKIEAYIQFVNQKGAARQKALEDQNLLQNPRFR